MLYSREWENNFKQKYKSTIWPSLAWQCHSSWRLCEVWRKFRCKIINQLTDLIWSLRGCVCCGNVNVYHQDCVLSCHLSQLLVHTIKSLSQKLTESWCQQWATIPMSGMRGDWASGHNFPLTLAATEVFDINNVLDNRAPWCLSVIIRSFLIFSLRVVARLNCQHSAPCWGVRTRQARPAITTGGYKAETTLQTPLVQVEFFRNQHEGDLGACCKVLLDKICSIK